MQVDRDELVTLLADLVSIKSVNPSYDPNSSEEQIGSFVGECFSKWRIPYETQQVEPGRSNVIGHLEGAGDGHLLFEAHLDTASINGMEIEPFEARCEAGLLYGRGSCDTKGGLAAMLYAMKRVTEKGLPQASITVAATADEEYSFRGVLELINSGFQADGAVVAEPTGLEIVIAHKGCLRWKVVTRGKAAHSSKIHLGNNAILAMTKIITELEKEIIPKLEDNHHPLLSSPTLNVGLIRGGTQVNTVPDFCEIEIDRRLLPGETKDTVWADFYSMLDRLRSDDSSLQVEMEEPMLEDVPLETAEDERVVRVALEASRRVLNKGVVSGVPFGTDASKLSRAGIPSIVLGPGSIDQAHSAVEFVPVDQVVQAAEIYGCMMLSF